MIEKFEPRVNVVEFLSEVENIPKGVSPDHLAIPGTLRKGHNTVKTKMKQLLAYSLTDNVGDGNRGYGLTELFKRHTNGPDSPLPTTTRPTIDSNTGHDGMLYTPTDLGLSIATLDDYTAEDYTAAQIAIFETIVNQGGDKNETFVEFYGKLKGPWTFDSSGSIYLVRSLHTASGPVYNYVQDYAVYTPQINEVLANRYYHLYWKFTF
jgi:hypothetical protein